MLIVRQAHACDLEDIFILASKAGAGLTTLPADKSVLSERIEHSLQSFKKDISVPRNEYYLWVLEDLVTHHVIGTAAIDAAVGFELPFFSYRLSKESDICHALNIRNELEVLTLVNDYQTKTEICSLFLDPNYRSKHNGSLLSRSRFIFMAQFPQRFADIVFAEMRGISDENGNSPFWESLGRKFFHMQFEQADMLTMTTNKQFIADLMPKHSIYTIFLAAAARQVIARPHASTVPAYNLLLREGFFFGGCIDIFDAGPTLATPINRIVTVEQSKVVRITEIKPQLISDDYIIGTINLDYKATLGHLNVADGTSCVLEQAVADVLELTVNDEIRICKLEHKL